MAARLVGLMWSLMLVAVRGHSLYDQALPGIPARCGPADAAAPACPAPFARSAPASAAASAAPASASAAAPAAAGTFRVGAYSDDVHGAEDQGAITTDDDGYKYRMLEGIVMPPYVTPSRLAASRAVATRPNDVCYTSYPKSGSTWLATILYLLLHNGTEPADGSPVRSHLHWVESAWTYPRTLEELDALPSPRIFKSHMPARLALGGGPAAAPCRFIYIARNPKDVCTSYYHFESNKTWAGNYAGSWPMWLERFLSGRAQRGDWFSHVLSWWELRHHENLLFITYEDLLRDFPAALARIAAHVGVELPPATAAAIARATEFGAMHANPWSNQEHVEGFAGFLRKGRVGSWRDRFTVAQSEAFDRVYAERMAGSGLDFEFV